LRAAQKNCFKLFGAETELEIGTLRRRLKVFIIQMTSFSTSFRLTTATAGRAANLNHVNSFFNISPHNLRNSIDDSPRLGALGKCLPIDVSLHPRVINQKIVLLSAMMKKNFTRKFVCKQQKASRRNICEGESCVFPFHEDWFVSFSGRKFSSSSLLKILFGLQIAFLMVTGMSVRMPRILLELWVGKTKTSRRQGKLPR
jgi:hypothetical protein